MNLKAILLTVMICLPFCLTGCGYVSVETYDAQIAEYDKAMAELQTAYSDMVKERNELTKELAQANADLDAYKNAVDDLKATIQGIYDEENQQLKDAEDLWNALTDAQRKAVTEGAERNKMTTYLIKNNEEYAEIYQYLLDLENAGTVTLESKEFKVYTEKKNRKFEIEKDYIASLETE